MVVHLGCHWTSNKMICIFLCPTKIFVIPLKSKTKQKQTDQNQKEIQARYKSQNVKTKRKEKRSNFFTTILCICMSS